MAEPKKKLIEPGSLLAEMEGIEKYNGPNWQDNWFELKRRIAAVTQEGEDGDAAGTG